MSDLNLAIHKTVGRMSDVNIAKRAVLLDILKTVGGRHRETPVHLATGEDTHVYLDVKGVLTNQFRMELAADVMNNWLKTLELAPTAVGGPTMGADVLSHPMVLRNDENAMDWFSIRDRVKTDHGMGKRIEGTELHDGDSVVIMDDVANSGKSLVEAVGYVRETGAEVLAVIPLVDRSDKTAAKMVELGVPYFPVFTSADLGLEPLK